MTVLIRNADSAAPAVKPFLADQTKRLLIGSQWKRRRTASPTHDPASSPMRRA